MNSTRNSIRRNRNIGTAKSGHGQANKLTIPQPWRLDFRWYYQRLTTYQAVQRNIRGRAITVLVEKTRKNYIHACTVDDIAAMFELIPSADWQGLELVVLRQPKVKEEILDCVWGRLCYHAEIDDYKGATIILEAVSLNKPHRWGKSLTPDDAQELERLREDGHIITTEKRYYRLDWKLESIRATQLYRTLLHEVGHWVDHQQKVEIPSQQGGDYSELSDKYFQRPSSERESFAHQYADKLRRKLFAKKFLPFERRLDEQTLMQDKLQLSDFVL